MLDDHGVAFDLTALTEFAGNVSGGVKQGSTFANQLGLNVDIDWGLMAGIAGLTTHAIFVNRSGASDSHLFGDNFLPVQEIWVRVRGGDVAVHLVSIYTEQSLFGGEFDLAMGRMNVENDFASSPLYCNFMNNMLCGDPEESCWRREYRAQRLSRRGLGDARSRPSNPAFYMTSGVYEVNQALYSDAFRTGFEFGTNHDSGVYLLTEVIMQPEAWRRQLAWALRDRLWLRYVDLSKLSDRRLGYRRDRYKPRRQHSVLGSRRPNAGSPGPGRRRRHRRSGRVYP